MIALLQQLWRVVRAIWGIGNRWLRIAISLAILWPAVVILVAVVVPSSVTRTATVSLVALLPFIVLFMIAMNAPLLWVAVAAVPRGRRILLWFLGFILLELLAGVYFAFVPVSNEPSLVIPFILVVITIALLKVVGWAPRTRTILVLLAIGITLVFLFGGWDKTKENVQNVVEQSATATVGTNPNGICNDASVLDYNTAEGAAPGTLPDQVAIVKQHKDCFKDVVILPEAYARIAGGVCWQPYPLPDQTHPNPNWAIRLQFVVNKNGIWIPWGEPTAWYHWTNRPVDKPYFSYHPFTFRLEVDAPEGGGVTFYPAPPGTACGPSEPS